MDYYNSFVIHPMLTDVLKMMKKNHLEGADFLEIQLKRHTRYAEQLERFYLSGRGPSLQWAVLFVIGSVLFMH